ncbi:hypothetical protein [Synechococcus elongatus]|uniref:Uncharacterized protein n=2 Tax=Synechococcus elongatus TaxID=32046 RepID=Q31RX5_SYNE7|nr:hypothetical protein [Synechococcus elongatus]ABB56194.1 hypothetical protein Synpcc7942_0162 [Synechococcus elongatus PCC 7942 = FACHB-805]AJD56753.1 hypothetical protein M744_02250 [Synechococcus elongatus UTEX 2973]MBD2588026.1 hypothetical protein [Synechococcus elongatus FACHB-242]MBD2689094.1 hypothetical protein [Synechococcus elongatus FACHB-1061]MBD2707266.1 hypothetical protein [Synechococcus elongatus PCC 7942 = FACHB-805]
MRCNVAWLLGCLSLGLLIPPVQAENWIRVAAVTNPDLTIFVEAAVQRDGNGRYRQVTVRWAEVGQPPATVQLKVDCQDPNQGLSYALNGGTGLSDRWQAVNARTKSAALKFVCREY